MSSHPSKYQVKVNHSEEEQFDVEHLSIDINPTLPTDQSDVIGDDDDDAFALANANAVNTKAKVPEDDDDADTDKDKGSCCFNSVKSSFAFASFLESKKIATLFAATALLGVGVGTIIGLSISGVVEQNHLQQQKALAAITGTGHGSGRSQTSSYSLIHSKTGKVGKSASSCLSGHDPIDKDGQDFCGDDEVIECVITFTNEEVVLSHDLFCTESVLYDATDDELMELNAAITLSGPEASIDCKGHTIRQISRGPGSFCLVGLGIGDPFEPSDYRKEMKKNCYNFYQAGILLIDGATAINCNVENFHDGFLVLNGGEVKKSETFGNVHGVFIQDLTGSFETMVSDVHAHDNAYGINVRNNDSSNSLTIEDVTCKLSYVGMALKGPDILVRDSTASHNLLIGITSVGPFETFIEPDYTTKIQFEGKVSSHHNEYGIDFGYLTMDDGDGSTKNAEVSVKGDVSTYLNRKAGLGVSANPNWDVLFTVEESGSWTSCQNSVVDMVNAYGMVSNFIDEGTDGYTCTTSSERYEYIIGPWSATCVPCPACE